LEIYLFSPNTFSWRGAYLSTGTTLHFTFDTYSLFRSEWRYGQLIISVIKWFIEKLDVLLNEAVSTEKLRSKGKGKVFPML
jgi:hypothetical protein